MAGSSKDGNDAYNSELDRIQMPEKQLDVVRVRLKSDAPLLSDEPITTTTDAVRLIANELKDYDREVFCVLNMDVRGRAVSMMNLDIVSIGTLTETAVHPRELFKSALLSSAASVIFFHNHPSGDIEPSDRDIQTTRRLVEAANILGIRALDHIVVGKDGAYFSFQENDLVFGEPELQGWQAAEAEAEAGYVADGEKKRSFREKVAEAFVKSLQENPREWTKNWASNDTGRPVNLASNRAYRGLNMAYLKFVENLQEFHDPRWLTFRQATDAGYTIPKGTKMTPVEYFFMYDNLTKKTIPWSKYNVLSEKEKSERINIATGKTAQPRETGSAIKARYELRHRDHYVFNASQLEGVPPYEYERTVNDIAASDLVDAVSSGMQVPIEYKEQDRAFYSPQKDRITLPLRSQFDSDYDYQSTALHELGHATGHEKRLGRDIQNTFGTPKYAYEELVAEITSCYMGEYISQPMSEADMDNHLAYVQGWIREIQADDRYLFHAMREAERAADYMIEKGSLQHLKEEVISQRQDVSVVSEARAEYDSVGSSIAAEMFDVAMHPLAQELWHRQMEFYEEEGTYFVHFYSDADRDGCVFNVDEAVRAYASGFQPYLKADIDARMEQLLRTKVEPMTAYMEILHDYASCGHHVVDNALPEGWRLSWREQAQSRDYLEHEIRQHIDVRQEKKLTQQCFQDALVRRGMNFRTLREAQGYYKADAQQKWQEKMQDTLAKARGKLLYAGEEM